jgi:hypothetical protein
MRRGLMYGMCDDMYTPSFKKTKFTIGFN